MHQDAVGQDDQVLIVDDVLATGGTAAATIRLVESCGATVAGLVFLIELETLNGRAALGKYAVQSLMVL
jgi:adenine phosphoribosyltransferase